MIDGIKSSTKVQKHKDRLKFSLLFFSKQVRLFAQVYFPSVNQSFQHFVQYLTSAQYTEEDWAEKQYRLMLQERFQKALRMKGIAVFLLEIKDQKACCPSDTGSLMKELISIGEKLGAMGEKLGTMGDKRLMETRLQTSANEVELKRLTGGIFTAKGIYYFCFTMNNLNTPPNSVVCLTKNGQRLVSVWDTVGTNAYDSGSNSVVIPLEVGDHVHVELQDNRLVYDNTMYYNTFSGFLLFPV